MSGQLLSSKIVIVEEEPQVRGISSAPTSVAGAVGITQRGPIGEAVLCSSFDEFQSIFGGFTPDSDLALAAMGFFENGGSQLWAVRTAHYADISDPQSVTAKRASGGFAAEGAPTPAKMVLPFPHEPMDATDPDKIPSIAVDGGPPTKLQAYGYSALLNSEEFGPFNLADGDTFEIRTDQGPPITITFRAGDFADIAAATSQEVVAALAGAYRGAEFIELNDGRIQIRSRISGTDSLVHVMGGTAVEKLGFTPDTFYNGSGNVRNLSNVTPQEIVAVINETFFLTAPNLASLEGDSFVLTSPTTGSTSSIAVETPEGWMTVFGEDAPKVSRLSVKARWACSYGNRIEAEVRAATNGDAEAFDLLVIEDGVYRELFANVTLKPHETRYVERVVNESRTGSSLVRLSDPRTDDGVIALTPQTAQLSGGSDGLEDLDDSDFIGSEAGKTGLHALDRVQELSLLLVPGRATPAVHNAMVRYCEVDRDGMAFAVLDSPADLSATEIVEYVTQTAALENFSEYAAIYWPRVKVLNPQRSVFGSDTEIVVPPSGIIAGVYARTDAAHPGGVYDPPAGIEKGRMFGVLGFDTDEVLEEKKRDLVYPHRINPLTTGPGLPRYIDGSRTLKGEGSFPYIAERRGVIFIERSLKQGLEFARHKNNTESLRAQVRRSITAFLLAQMNNGAFRSREPAKAFYVDVSDQLNTPSVVFAGQLIARVGLATNKPAEFIILRISQDTRALEAELASAGG